MLSRRPVRYLPCILVLATRSLVAVEAPSRPAQGAQPTASREEPEPPSESALPAPEELRARIKTVETSTDLDPAVKAKVIELLSLAAAQTEDAQRFSAREKGYRDAIESAPAEVARIRQRLTEKLAAAEPAAGLTLAQLEVEAAKSQADLTARKNAVEDLDRDLKSLEERLSKARSEQEAARAALQQVEQEMARPAAAAESSAVVDARSSALGARRAARSQEIRMLDQELLSLPARQELGKARREEGARLLGAADARAKSIQELLTAAKREEARREQEAAAAAKREAAGKHPLVQRLAAENAELSQKLTEVTRDIERARLDAEEARVRREGLEEDERNVQQTLSVVGVSDALGQFLLRQRRSLPDLREYRASAAANQRKLAQAGLSQFRFEEKLRDRRDLESALDGLISAEVEPSLPAGAGEAIAEEAASLLAKQRELLEKLVKSYADFRSQLDKADDAERLLLQQSTNYAAYLDRELLWIPNLPPMGSATPADIRTGLTWLFSAKSWSGVGDALVRQLQDAYGLTAVILLATLVLFLLQRRIHARLQSMTKRVGKVHADGFLLTVEAVFLNYLMATAWSILAWYAGRRLVDSMEATSFARSIGYGLHGSALLLWGTLGTLWLLAPDGVGRIHLRWRESAVALLRRHLRWLAPVLLPSMFLVYAASSEFGLLEGEFLGRLAYLVAMLALAAFGWRVLRPESGLLDRLIADRSRSWVWRLRYVWYPLAIAAPLVLAVLAGVGYYYSALMLSNRLLGTVGVVAGAAVLHDLVLRWFRVARNRFALAKALERRDAAQGGTEAKAGLEDIGDVLETAELNLRDIDDQIGRLLRAAVSGSVLVGLWFIWDDIVPAFRVLEQVSLWPHSVIVDGQEVLKAISLADLLLAVIVGIFAAVAARNLPALLEIAVLRHLPMDPGSRYAFTTIAQYAIGGIGIVLALNAIGVGWSQARWLVAALSFGLGFGLQEIFANLVSGLMILFERPFRVGDVVTVGDHSGVVSRIRIRATTVVDWDHKEVIIPNKAFITDRLVNWSLSDQVTRLLLKVGISYGSDATRAQVVMLETVKSHPLVLDDPPPSVYLVGFGESSLDFEIRLFVRRLDERLPATHEINTALYKALAEHGIEIPLPQRDIRVRSAAGADPSVQRISGAAQPPAAPPSP